MTTKQAWIKRKKRYGISGFKNPEERKRKISENTKKALAKPEVKIKIINDRKRRKLENGYINSQKTRKKLSEIMKRKWANGNVTELQRTHIRGQGIKTQFKKGHEVTQKTREAVKKSRAKQIFPKEDTKIEVKIQKFLTKLHIEYFTHKYMKIYHRYQCDIFIPIQKGILQKTIIEADGCYWHGCDLCGLKQNENTKKVMKKDKQRTKELIKKGFRVIRIWEHNIKKMELNNFKMKIKEYGIGM